jgi:uncharacterized protein
MGYTTAFSNPDGSMGAQSTILIIAAFLTATLSGFLGMGGGILLLTVMAAYFPPTVLIPLHGAVQLVSNSVRVTINWRHITWSILGPMIAGSLVGAALGSRVALALPETGYQLVMGLFILAMTWMPEFGAIPRIRGKFFWLGGLSTALSLFVGATGPLLAPFFLKEGLKKESIIATKAGGQATTHFLKVGVFSIAGFQLAQHAALFTGMVIAVTLGTAFGKLLLGKVSERVFVVLFKALVTLLAGRMVLKSLTG